MLWNYQLGFLNVQQPSDPESWPSPNYIVLAVLSIRNYHRLGHQRADGMTEESERVQMTINHSVAYYPRSYVHALPRTDDMPQWSQPLCPRYRVIVHRMYIFLRLMPLSLFGEYS